MNKTTLRRLHTSGMPSQAKAIVNTVIKYAEKNKQLRTHSMSIVEFCIFAGLEANMPISQLVGLMARARKAVVSLKVVASIGAQKKEVLTGSAPVFDFILITETHVSFEVCRYLWEEYRCLMGNN